MDDNQSIWLTGYKGTDETMSCLGYQYHLLEHHIHLGEMVLCHEGFHFCTNLSSVFYHYPLDGRNRFFEVLALVDKTEIESIQQYQTLFSKLLGEKRVAKEIILQREITYKELKPYISAYLFGITTKKEYAALKTTSYVEVITNKYFNVLLSLGYLPKDVNDFYKKIIVKHPKESSAYYLVVITSFVKNIQNKGYPYEIRRSDIYKFIS